MWYCVHVVQVVQCTCGVVYMLCRCCHVHMILSTRSAAGAMYRRYCVHVVHMVLVYVWYCVHVIHLVLWACSIMYVHHVVVVLRRVYSFCCNMCRYIYWVVLHIRYIWMHYVVH